MAIGAWDMTRPVYRADFKAWMSTSNRTFAEYVTWDTDIVLRSMHNMFSGSNWNSSLKVVVYQVSNQSKIYDSGFFTSGDFTYSVPGYILELPNAPTLYAGVQYAIGYYTNGGANIGEYYDSWLTNSEVFSSGSGGPTLISTCRMYYRTGDGFPSSTWRNISTFAGGWTIDRTNQVPTAPTSISVTNSPVPNEDPVNVQWTHNDPDGDPQSKYQLRWRKL